MGICGKKYLDPEFDAIDLHITTTLFKDKEKVREIFMDALHESGVSGDTVWFVSVVPKHVVLDAGELLINNGEWCYD